MDLGDAMEKDVGLAMKEGKVSLGKIKKGAKVRQGGPATSPTNALSQPWTCGVRRNLDYEFAGLFSLVVV